jgi:propionyl-CoA carboxylase beta chain
MAGFARLVGRSIVVGNQLVVLADALDINASTKAARFVRFCDLQHLLLKKAERCVRHFPPGTDQEWRGIITNGATAALCLQHYRAAYASD